MDCSLVQDIPPVKVHANSSHPDRKSDPESECKSGSFPKFNGFFLAPRHTRGKSFMQICSLFLSNPVDGQTDKQTNATKKKHPLPKAIKLKSALIWWITRMLFIGLYSRFAVWCINMARGAQMVDKDDTGTHRVHVVLSPWSKKQFAAVKLCF